MPFSLAGGGRFDELVERLSGVAVPACGFSIGFERVYTLMEERGMFEATARAADVLVALPSADAAAGGARASRPSCAPPGCASTASRTPPSSGPQFELAERKGIPFAVVADPEKLRGRRWRSATCRPAGIHPWRAPSWRRGSALELDRPARARPR